jgi:DNA-binding Lrp family transcriptional regulator
MLNSKAMNEKIRDILSILSRDSRTPAESIARQIGLSAQEVTAAIESLEKESVIKRYTTAIDWEKAGEDKVTAFIDVRVVPARDVGFDAIALRIARYAQVKSIWLVSGGSDLRIVVEATNLRELANFVAEKLSTIEGVTATDTHFVLRRYKEDDCLYLEGDTDERLAVAP